MKNDYLYAVANIRANEVSLLTDADLEQLINAPDYKRAAAILADKGYSVENDTDYSKMLDREIAKTWELLTEVAPDAEPLKAFIIKNDFQNLKAALKAEVTEHDAEDYIVSPSVIDGKELILIVKERRFDDLPSFMADAAKEAFDTIISTHNGQLCDIIADKACLEAVKLFSKQADDETLFEYAEIFVMSADLKTAYRAMKTGKGKGFLETALCGSDTCLKEDLISAALSGEDGFFDYLNDKGLSEYADTLKNSPSSFEKFCDNGVMKTMKKAKYTAFGISPLAAYFFARMTEIGCVRIILSAKFNGSSASVVRERMRELYV